MFSIIINPYYVPEKSKFFINLVESKFILFMEAFRRKHYWADYLYVNLMFEIKDDLYEHYISPKLSNIPNNFFYDLMKEYENHLRLWVKFLDQKYKVVMVNGVYPKLVYREYLELDDFDSLDSLDMYLESMY